ARRLGALGAVIVLSFCDVALAQPAGTFTSTGNMTTARSGNTATLLPDGKVLIAGGQTPPCCAPPSILSSAELYDPSTGSFTATGRMTTARAGHTATVLPDGKVLIAGGYFLVDTPRGPRAIALTSAELYDPATGTFSATGDLINGGGPWGSTAILLADGRVLIAHDNSGTWPTTAELYDAVTGTFSRTGDPLVIWVGTQNTTLSPHPRELL